MQQSGVSTWLVHVSVIQVSAAYRLEEIANRTVESTCYIFSDVDLNITDQPPPLTSSRCIFAGGFVNVDIQPHRSLMEGSKVLHWD